MNRKAVTMLTQVIIGLIIAVPLLLIMFKVSQGVFGILFPRPVTSSVDYVFNNFIEYYYNCKESEAIGCSCGAFNYRILLRDYKIELEQKGNDTEISLLSREGEKISESLVEGNILCVYIPLREEGERVEILDNFEIEEGSMEHGIGTIFSHEGNIFLMKYDELHLCFPIVSPALENYNEFMKFESCF